jgi:hypothetical protein
MTKKFDAAEMQAGIRNGKFFRHYAFLVFDRTGRRVSIEEERRPFDPAVTKPGLDLRLDDQAQNRPYRCRLLRFPFSQLKS